MTALAPRTIHARVRDNPFRGLGTVACKCGCQDRRSTDAIAGGFLVTTQDGVPVLRPAGYVEMIEGPLVIQGGRPFVISASHPAYRQGQAIAAAADAQREHGVAVNTANRIFWSRGKK